MTPRRALARPAFLLLTAAVVIVGCAASAGPAAALAAAGPVAAPPVAAAAPARSLPAGVRWPAVGALFGGPPDQLGDHYCSASVVDTPAGNVVLTAAHCVADGSGAPARTGMSFVPGYHDHTEPFGVWTVTAAAVDDAWRDHGDPDHDLAFLTVTRDGGPAVQAAVGGYRLVLDPGGVTAVDALGYPDFADAPTVRSGSTARFSPTQLRLDAPGLYDGTSGGPWLRAAPGGPPDTEIVGVTGGYEQGGLDPAASYSAYLGDAAAALFRATGGMP